jgi:esterase
MKLFCREIGSSGQPLLILHGVFGSSDNWLGIGKTLSEKYQIFLIDQRNHGQSPHSDEFSYKTMAADLKEFIEEHNLHKPIIIGHSMGGKTVMQFAIENPDAFDKIIVVDIAPKAYPVHHRRIIEGLQAIDLDKIQTRNEADLILSEYEYSAGVRQFLLKNLYRNLEKNTFEWKLNLSVIAQKLADIGQELITVSPIQKDVLFMAGSESRYILPEDHDAIQAMFPLAKFVSIEGAGHWVQAEKPQEFVSEVLRFLDSD